MITFHLAGQRGIECTDLAHCHRYMREAIWIDLHKPTEQEEIIVDAACGIELPTQREMQDIEVSRRLYKGDQALYMTATIVTKASTGLPQNSVVTFIIAGDRLITLRYAEPLPFEFFRSEREADLGSYDSGPRIFGGLLEKVVERLADLLEMSGATLDQISREIFQMNESAPGAREGDLPPRNLEQVLMRLGRCSDLISRVRESLASLVRLLSFFTIAQRDLPADLSEHLRSLSRDFQPLADHASFLAQKVSYLQDATLGLINIEQNVIIKVFTIASVLFLPPTVVGTIYGMNFEGMPELRWPIGYPLAIVLMIVSALVPYYYFKRRGWF